MIKGPLVTSSVSVVECCLSLVTSLVSLLMGGHRLGVWTCACFCCKGVLFGVYVQTLIHVVMGLDHQVELFGISVGLCSCGHSFLYGGQPLNTVFFTRFMVWSCAVENFTAARSMGVDMKWILRCGAESSVTCSGLYPASLWHTCDRASATGMDRPCL